MLGRAVGPENRGFAIAFNAKQIREVVTHLLIHRFLWRPWRESLLRIYGQIFCLRTDAYAVVKTQVVVFCVVNIIIEFNLDLTTMLTNSDRTKSNINEYSICLAAH